MSKEFVNQFLQKVTEDSALQEELAKALEAENDRQATTDLAKKHGYKFTSDELWAEIQNRQSQFQQQATGQLGAEELEAVAGGATPTILATPSTPAIGGAIGGAGAVGAGVINAYAKW